MNSIIQHITKKLSNYKNEWIFEPFPHIVVDDFFPQEVFDKISDTISSNEKNFKDVQSIYNTPLEFGKKTYNDTDLNKNLKIPIEIMGSEIFKKMINSFFEKVNIISLTDIENYGGYSPFHVMHNKGFLGSHVDHSRSIHGDFHIANSIFYASPNWLKNDGGETILFNHNGLVIKKLIKPKPNRLIIFLHSAETFHGVNTISNSSNNKRYTYYMDYYIKKDDLKNTKLKININEYKPKYSDHDTTFIPLFPLGLKSFKLKSILNLKLIFQYFFAYFKYLFNKRFKKINFN